MFELIDCSDFVKYLDELWQGALPLADAGRLSVRLDLPAQLSAICVSLHQILVGIS
jgi:hypothetical protein